MAEHASGRKNHAMRLWVLLILERWFARYEPDFALAMKPLSIVHTENSCGWGGQEIRILTEARGLLDRGHRVTLVAPAEAPIAAAGEQLGLPVVRLDIRAEAAARTSSRCAAGSPRSARAIDVLNTHSSTDSWLVGARLRDDRAARRRSCARATCRPRSATAPTTRWLYARATAHIVTTGEALRRQLARDNGVPLDHMTSIPTGIDLARFVPGDAAARARAARPAAAARRSASSPRCATGRATT